MADEVHFTVHVPWTVEIDPDGPVSALWKSRLSQHTSDRYRGRCLAKMPEDLRVYQHLIDACRPNVIVELGTYDGGSAVWFADQLDTFCGGGLVITIDLRFPTERLSDERIVSFEGDLSESFERISSHIPPGSRVMVVDDSAHTYASTSDALRLYAPLVTPGSWFVVEDGVVDEPISIWGGSGGVQPAVRDFLATPGGERFRQHHLAIYGITTNHNGWLEAIR